jgi:hypothetical protein
MYAGKPLNGEKGIFALLLKHFLEATLEDELYTAYKRKKPPVPLIGKMTRGLKNKNLSGEFNLEYSRDCNSSFDTLSLPKRHLIITE